MRRAIVVVVWLATAASGAAQPSGPHGTVSAGAINGVLLRAPVPGQSNPSLPTTGIGGSAIGVVAGVDIAVSRRIGIDAEFSTSGFASDYQEATKYHSRVRHRDTFISGYARCRLWNGSTIHVEALGGASLVLTDTQLSTSRLEFVPMQHYGPFGDYERWPFGQRRYALSGGVDVPIDSGRVAVVPSIRLHYIVRDEDTKNQIGLGRWAVRPGIGLRVRF
ncbi:MAG: hypothetical protein IMZ67_00110 [Acidobacteria bacterium]|nr:hypothetical protein [Acidobacteriota bacterium]